MTTERPLRMALVTTAFPRWPNDSRGPSMWETARALRDLGVGVRVITLHSPGARARETWEGVDVVRARYLWPERLETLQSAGGGLPAVWRQGGAARLAFGPFFGALTAAVARYSAGCDVIHAHWTLAGIAAWWTQPLHRLPFVLTVHGSDVFQAPRLPVVGGQTRAMLRRCSHVVAVSRALADATSALGLPAAKVEVIPDGIDVERFQAGPAEREPLVLFVGSLIERKGVHHLLGAWPAVLARCPEARLVVAGDGPERAGLEALARTLQIAERVEFVGSQSQAQVAAWMQRARLFVLPSLEEALGIVLLEALVSGTPCVATRVGGIPEVVTSEVGRVVPPSNPEALAAALGELLTDAELWRTMSARARPYVLQNLWTWKKVAARLVTIYQAVRRA